jgi:hypothetical protein
MDAAAQSIIEGNPVIRPSDRAVFKELADGSAVILHLDTAASHGVNQIGTVIWSLLRAGISFEDLVTELGSTVENAPPELREDVAEFIQELAQRDLVEFVPSDQVTKP